MAQCTNCGRENVDDARFCSACGALIAPEAARAEVRKTVTVVFSDVTGSTSLGERLDPEALRRVMSRYFDAMSSVLELHGGTVEKFVGDAIMAVFGIPQLHEDDALRAVRAAAEMRERLAQLNDELERDWGVRIQTRTGVNTGDVVAADPSAGQRFVTGDAVNVAARLEQASAPGEILLGDDAYRLVKNTVRAEAVEALELKGKTERVAAYRLVDVLADVPAFTRPLDTRFVGRERELALLRAEFEQTAADRACRLVTVLGPPGIGKSRLVRELLSSVGEQGRFAVGRCLPYGEGITFWPLVEIVKQVGGDDAQTTTARLLFGDEHADLIAERVAAAIGQGESAGVTEETFWAVRRFFEALARERPLVAVFDDIQWAESTFLDLVEYLLGFSSDAPILILCVARPDLLEARPSWASPRANASSILLEPLSEGESETLVERLASGTELTEPARERILEAAEGNPLFVEQMLALQAESGEGVTVPPTIQALLAARIDRLEPDERAVIARASVEGKLFHRGAVAELVPRNLRPAVGAHLLALVRKEFVRPDRAEFPGDDGFRFGHILIRDAAYGSIPKELRAELHERYSSWLERAAGERQREYEELVGYHLEQSYRYRTELGRVDDRARAVALSGAERLASAGRRAYRRGDISATVSLLSRALSLLPSDDPARPRQLLDLAVALTDLERSRAEPLFDEAVDTATVAGDEATLLRAKLWRSFAHLLTDPRADPAETRRIADSALARLEELGDEGGVSLAWHVRGTPEYVVCHAREGEQLLERSFEHAARAGDEARYPELLGHLANLASLGPTPLVEGLARLEELRRRAKRHRVAQGAVLLRLSDFEAMRGRFDEGRAALAQAEPIFRELGQEWLLAETSFRRAWLELQAGELDVAERELCAAYEGFREIGEPLSSMTAAIRLAEVALARGNLEDAERWAQVAGETVPASQFVLERLLSKTLEARLLVRRGEPVRAEQLAEEAVELAGQIDWLNLRADVLVGAAEVFSLAKRPEDARLLVEEALQLYEQKGNVVSAERARALLSELVTA